MVPRLQVRIKTHKEQYPIRPVVHNINAPTYRTARLLNSKLLEILQLANSYSVLNSTQLANDLTTLKLNKHHKCISLDIKDLFTNIPIRETINITKHILKYNHLTEDTITQCINLLHIILTQNYLSYDNKYYTLQPAKRTVEGLVLRRTLVELVPNKGALWRLTRQSEGEWERKSLLRRRWGKTWVSAAGSWPCTRVFFHTFSVHKDILNLTSVAKYVEIHKRSKKEWIPLLIPWHTPRNNP